MRNPFWVYADKSDTQQAGEKGLSREESIELGKLAEAGDEQAKERLYNSARRLVKDIAKKESRRLSNAICLTFDDLIQEGRDGLSLAVEKYDYRRNCKFSVLAYIRVRAIIGRFILENSRTVKIAHGHTSDFNKFNRISNKFFAEFGRWPNTEEIADIAGCDEKFVAKVMWIHQHHVVYLGDFVAGPTESQSYEDVCEKRTACPETNCYSFELSEEMQKALAHLTTREQEIIHAKYLEGRDRTFLEISEAMQIPCRTIRRVHDKALDKLKRFIMEHKL